MSHLAFYHNMLIGLHIIAVIAWMAGLLYLPRLFAYHMRATADGEMDQTFRVMEAKVMQIILNPAMTVVWLLGLTLIWFDATQERWGWGFLLAPWMLTKLAGVLFLTGWHYYLMRAQKRFASGERVRSERFWRMTNELPFVAAIIMVLAITTKFAF